MMTKDQRSRLVKQVMMLLDDLSDDYFIHKPPVIKKSDNLDLGWGDKKRKTTINFVFQTEKPTRVEIESRVKGFIDLMSNPM